MADTAAHLVDRVLPEVPVRQWALSLPCPRLLACADFLRRVFAVDVLECPRCAGPMRILATIHPPDVTQAILDCLELPSRAPPTAAAAPRPAEWDDSFEGTR
jgi:hypothetical protein